MKKKLILAASVAIVAAAAFCGISSAVRISSKNDILNQNVEALSSGELNLNDPVWIKYHREDGGFNCTRGGEEVC